MIDLSALSPRRSLIGKLLFFGIVPSTLIFVCAIAYGAWSTLIAARAEQEQTLRNLAEQVALEVERGNTRAVLAAEVMALAQTSGQFGNRVKSTEFARQVLGTYPEFTGAYFGYEPNADQNDTAFLHSPEAGSIRRALGPTGRFLPYWFRDREAPKKISLTPLVDMETSLYYNGVKRLFGQRGTPTPIVTEPYAYEGKLIVEQTYPIVIDGRFKGIAGVDRALDDILAFLSDVKTREDVDIVLVSGRGRIIATTTGRDAHLRTRKVAETAYDALLGPLTGNGAATGFAEATDPFDGGSFFFVSAPVPTGDWTVVIRSAVAKVLAPLWERVARIVLIAGTAIILAVIVLARVLLLARRRISAAVAVSDDVAVGLLPDIPEMNDATSDEVGRLNRSLAKLVATQRDVTEICIAISEGDFTRSVTPRGEHDDLARAINAMARKRQEAEDGIRSERRRFRNLLESSPDAMIMVDRSGSIVFANRQAAHLFGYPMTELIGQPVEILVPDKYRADHVGLREGYFTHQMEHGMRGDTKFFAKAHDGRVFPVEVSLGPIETEEGTFIAASVRDVSARITTEEELHKRIDDLADTRRAGVNMMMDLDQERKRAEYAFQQLSGSIEYASRIQRSLLPQEAFLNEDLAEHFVLWEPRDVVGGDLYWYRRCTGGFIVALADCTGHGVPGAFMTLLATGALDRALRDSPSGDPGDLLARINRSIKYSLAQAEHGESESDDGLEMGICRIDKDRTKLVFAGARFPLFVVENDEVEEIKSTRAGLGYRRIPEDQAYETVEIRLSGKKRFFMASDGLLDQVGGPKHRGFGKKRLKELLIAIQSRTMSEQRSAIIDTLRAYQGEELRRDDVSVMGFKVV